MQITIPVYTGIEDETQKLRITRSTADAETQLFLSSTAAGHYLLCYRVGRPTLAISVADLIDALAAAQDRPHHATLTVQE